MHEEATGFNTTKIMQTKAHKNYKTKECETFNKVGSCPYGDMCAFIHKSKPDIKRSISEDFNDIIKIQYNLFEEIISGIDMNSYIQQMALSPKIEEKNTESKLFEIEEEKKNIESKLLTMFEK